MGAMGGNSYMNSQAQRMVSVHELAGEAMYVPYLILLFLNFSCIVHVNTVVISSEAPVVQCTRQTEVTHARAVGKIWMP
jgi:hypothetical protein